MSLSSSWSGDRSRLDSAASEASKDVSASAVSDWSVEVSHNDDDDNNDE